MGKISNLRFSPQKKDWRHKSVSEEELSLLSPPVLQGKKNPLKNKKRREK